MSLEDLNNFTKPIAAAVVSAEMKPEDQNPSITAATEVAAENLEMTLNPTTAAKEAAENLEMALNPTTAAAKEVTVGNLEIALNPAAAAKEVKAENLEMALNPTTAAAKEVTVGNLEIALNPTAAAKELAVENLEIALNPSTASAKEVKAENLEMALNPTMRAATVLDMVLSTTNSTSEARSLGQTVDAFGTFPKKARSWRRRYEPPPPTSEEEEYLAKCLAFFSHSNCRSSTRNTSNSVDITPNSKPINNEKKRDFLEPQNRSYECTICNKSFTTYQALGGHKASHSNRPAENNVLSSPTALHNVSSLNLSGRAHVCSICHKAFNTGQALGGHKRLHYGQICNTRGRGGNDVLCDTSREQDMVQTKDLFLDKKPGGDVIVHNFDLNLQPQAEPESEPEERLNTDSETMATEVSGNEVGQGHLPMKKPRLTIKLDLELSLPYN